MTLIGISKLFTTEGGSRDVLQYWLDLTLATMSPEMEHVARVCAIPAWFDLRLISLLTGADNLSAVVVLSKLLAVELAVPLDEGGYTYPQPIRQRLLRTWHAPQHRDSFATYLLALADYYLTLVEEQIPRLRGPEREAALTMLDRFYPNVQAVWEGAVILEHHLLIRRLVSLLDSYHTQRRLWEQKIAWLRSGIRACQSLGDDEGSAEMWHSLGIAYTRWDGSDPLERTRQAIACYREALKYYTPERDPHHYVIVQNNLGSAYLYGKHEDPDAAREEAIACYREALRYCLPDQTPALYAMLHSNLAFAYASRTTGDRAANLRRAIACYRAVLDIYTPRHAPHIYANVKKNLGILYMQLPDDDREANLRRAIACFHDALTIWQAEGDTLMTLSLQENLSTAYETLARLYARRGDLEAIHALVDEVAQLPAAQNSRLWAAIGGAYFRLGRVADALKAFRRAVRLDFANRSSRSQDKSPYATTGHE